MATPELEGSPVIVSGENVRSLGFDFYVPGGLGASNLITVAGWKQGTGSTGGVIARVDGAIATLGGASTSATGSDSIRMTLNQFRNLSSGWRRVHIEPSSGTIFDSAFLLALLLKNSGELSNINALFTFPATTPTVATTARFVLIYWGYQATTIEGGGLKTVQRVAALGYSLGSLIVQTAVGAGATLVVAPNVTAETTRIGGYVIAPYATS